MEGRKAWSPLEDSGFLAVLVPRAQAEIPSPEAYKLLLIERLAELAEKESPEGLAGALREHGRPGLASADPWTVARELVLADETAEWLNPLLAEVAWPAKVSRNEQGVRHSLREASLMDWVERAEPTS